MSQGNSFRHGPDITITEKNVRELIQRRARLGLEPIKDTDQIVAIFVSCPTERHLIRASKYRRLLG